MSQPRPSSLHHVAIAVTCIERSTAFYQSLLNLKRGREFASSNGVSRIVYLDGEGFSLELTSRSEKMSRSVRRDTESRFKHIAISCDNAKRLQRYLLNVGFSASEVKYKLLDQEVIEYFFVEDPDGNEVEFINFQDTKK